MTLTKRKGRAWDENRFHLSQSTMKAYQEYSDKKLCGLVFKEQSVLYSLEDETTPAQRLGHYFEYEATGALPRDGEIPEPERYQKSGTAKGVPFYAGDLKGDYIYAKAQSDYFKKYCEEMGLKILVAGTRMKRDGGSGLIDLVVQVSKEKWDEFTGMFIRNWEVTIDDDPPVYEDCTWTDDKGGVHLGCVVIDLKYSALLYDKWNKYGWDLESMNEKDSHKVQAKHYHWLSNQLPFYFWVFSSAKDYDARIIRVKFDPFAMEDHIKGVAKVRKNIIYEMKTIFRAYPSLYRCNRCPLRADCSYRAKRPGIFVSYFGL